MAAQNVTTTEGFTNYIAQGARLTFRNSAGIPYVLVKADVGASSTIYMYKGNSTTPTDFTPADSITGLSEVQVGDVAGRIDGNDVIHVAYYDEYDKSTPLLYATFRADGSNDDFNESGTSLVGDIGELPTAGNLYVAVAVDSNNYPHIVYNEYPKISGASTYTVDYINKTGGSWQTPVDVEHTQNKNMQHLDIAIDTDDKPQICYLNSDDADLGLAHGTANNATSFDLYDADTNITAVAPSICVDFSGNTYVGYSDAADSQLHAQKLAYGGNWSTGWTEYDSAIACVKDVSAVAEGADIYFFYEDASADTHCVTYISSAWTDKGALDTGTYSDLRAKWGFWVDNDSGGSILETATYYFDGSDAAASAPDGGWSDVTNADDGSVDTDATYTEGGSETTKYLQIEGTDATSTDPIIAVEVRIHDETEWKDFHTIAHPSGGWTLTKVQTLEIRFANTGPGNLGVWIYEDGNAGGTELSTWTDSVGSAVSRIDIKVTTRSSAFELDYVFSDGTDIHWNRLLMPVTYTKTVTAKASILKTQDQTVTAKGDIFKADNTQTIAAKGKLYFEYTKTVTAKANIFRTYDQTIAAKGKIKHTETETVTAKAEVHMLVIKFDETTYRDAGATDADWNTTDGKVYLPEVT